MGQPVSSKRSGKRTTLGGDLEELALEIMCLSALVVTALRIRWAALFAQNHRATSGARC
jgi:hypothetical protein